MTVQLINPDGVFKPESYFQVGVGQGASIVCLSGQVALDAEGELVGHGDLEAQTAQVYRNIFHALAGVGASLADVIKLTVYVPNYTSDMMGALVMGAQTAGRELGFDSRKPITLVGVVALASPDFLLEVEAMALRPH